MNILYNVARNQFATGSIDWRVFNPVFIAWGGTPDFNPLDTIVSHIKARGNVELSRSLPITSKTVTPAGNLQTNNVVLPSVPAGSTVTWFTFCRAGVTADGATPLLFVDDAENLPYDTDGLDVIITPDWVEARGWGRL